jgi:AcrR family transcriptional regulator
VQDVTERAGINRATFYAHFQDKYALLAYSIHRSFQHEIEKRTLNACHFSIKNLRVLIIAVYEFMVNANAHCKPPEPHFESLVERQVKEEVYDLLFMWLEQMESAVSPEMAATATSWALYGLASQGAHQKSPEPAEAFANRVMPLIAANLQIPEMS